MCGQSIQIICIVVNSTVENIIRFVRSDRENNTSTDFIVTYRLDIPIVEDVVVVATVYLPNDSIANPVGQPLEKSLPSALSDPNINRLTISNYTGLEPDTDYRVDVRILHNNSRELIGRQATASFATRLEAGMTTGMVAVEVLAYP